MKSFLVSVFRFFASLALAMTLLLLLAIVLAVGTFVESAYGAETAKALVYRNPGVGFLLILLALNVAASALDRLPWKKKHVGFVVTHTGILLILAGSLVSQATGIEGQMAVREGETAGRMILDAPLLQLFRPEEGSSLTYSIPSQSLLWKKERRLKPDSVEGPEPPGGLKVTLLKSYLKASREERFKLAEEGSPALGLKLESSFLVSNHWLLLDDREQSEINLGPAVLRFSREPVTAPSPAAKKKEDFLKFRFEKTAGGTPIQVPIPDKLPKKISLKGTPYQVTIERVLRDAVVEGRKLVDRSEEWKNPACELLLEGDGIKERHTVFSEFPDFETIHGREPSQTGVKILYLRGDHPERTEVKNELRFVWQGEGLPRYQVRKGEKIVEGDLELKKEYETGWMDFKFRVEAYYPHARREFVFKEEPRTSEKEEHQSAIQIELRSEGAVKSLWLGQGDHEEVEIEGKLHHLVYGLRTLPVGFRLELKDFRIETYPGSSQPASFESDVVLKDDFTGTVKAQTIKMNQPLKHRGFKIFQSGYQLPEGEAEISVFSVAKDPGIPLKYAGAVVLVAGILIMFYTRKFSNQREEAGVTV